MYAIRGVTDTRSGHPNNTRCPSSRTAHVCEANGWGMGTRVGWWIKGGEKMSKPIDFQPISRFVLDRRYIEQHHRPAPTVITTRTAITSNVHGTSSVSSNKSTTTSSSTKISDTVSAPKIQDQRAHVAAW